MIKFFSIFLVGILLLLTATFSLAREHISDAHKLEKGWVVSSISHDGAKSLVIVNVEAVINAPPKKVWELLSNIDGWDSWMPVIKRGWVLPTVALSKMPDNPEKTEDLYRQVTADGAGVANICNNSRSDIVTFEEFDLPWPVSNDWDLRKYSFDPTSKSEGKYIVSWKQLFKGTEGRGGSWEISEYKGLHDKTIFKYHLRVKRKDGVPKKLFEIVIGKTIDRFIGAIRKHTEYH